MKVKNSTAVFAALAALSPLATCPADEITAERFPDADTVLVEAREDVAYCEDGTYTNTTRKTVKILTERGRRGEGTLSIRYSQRYGTAEILSVSVAGADGSSREIDFASTLKDATSNSSMSSNIYDPMDRVMTCQVPGLKVGDTLTYATRRVATKPRIENVFADTAVFEWSMPVVKSVYSVKAPRARPLKAIALRHPLGNVAYEKRTLEDGSTLHEWTATNSPQAFPEPHMPSLSTEVEALHVSTAADWREISDWYWKLSLPHIEKTTAEMTNLVESLGRDIDRIRVWVAENVRYMGLTMEDKSPGYAPHDIDITFKNRYGVCRDKAALLAALLNMAGHEAYPVLIRVGAKMDPDVPSPYFNHAIVAVADKSAPDGYRLMDPTPETSRDECPAYLRNRSYLVARPGGETLLVSPVKSASENCLKVRTKGKVADDLSAVLETTISFGGSNDSSQRKMLVRMTPEDMKRHFETIASAAAPGSEILSLDVSPKDMTDMTKPLEVSFVTRVPELGTAGESTIEIAVPVFSSAMGTASAALHGATSLKKRRFTLEVFSTAENDEETVLELPPSFGEPVFLPETAQAEGGYSFLRKFTVSEGSIALTTRFAVNALEFPPEAYQDLLDAIERRAAAYRKSAVFEKNDLAEATYRSILWKRAFYLSSPRSWVATNVFSKKILTYDAKKLSSDLHWSFVPAVGDFKLLGASVANPGKPLAFVGEREMNVMDDWWVAKAPRYPAEKTLVANLPSVEVGSVTTVTTVTEVVNSPLPFRGEFAFDVTEPSDEIDISVNYLGTNIFSRTVKNAKTVKREARQPPGNLWRDIEVVSFQTLEDTAAYLRKASVEEGVKAPFEIDESSPPEERMAAIRNWMARHVRIIGPSLHSVPIDMQATPPETVLAERYASRLDYVRTMTALMKGAGLEADVVFARNNGGESEEEREFQEKHPNYSLFCNSLCRVRALGSEYFLGSENEYTPVGSTGFDGSDYLDPKDGKIASIGVVEERFRNRAEHEISVWVNADGSADFEFETRTFGSDVGVTRKAYAEMLPEARFRRHLALVKGQFQSAEPKGEFVTDIESYPMSVRYGFHVPDYAVISGDLMKLALPGLRTESGPFVSTRRTTPFKIPRSDPERTEVKVFLPKGYATVEHSPETFRFEDKRFGLIDSLEAERKTAPDGSLELRFVRERALGQSVIRGAEHIAEEKSRYYAGTRKGAYTLTVRKGEEKKDE